MDRICSVCGLDYTSVKLTTMQAMTHHSRNKNEGMSITVCETCKVELLKHNYPDNQNLGEASPDQPGFIKPSGVDDKPAVRPQ